MKNREKTLGVIVAAFVGLLVLYMLLRALLLSPAERLEGGAEKLARQIDRITSQKRIYDSRAGRLAKLAARTLGCDVNLASEEVRARLVKILQRSGLGGKSMSLTPSLGPKFKDYYKEIAWTVSEQGKLEDVMSFLYLLGAEPYLHRVENISLSPVRRSGQVEIKLRFATLVLTEPKGRKLPVGEFPDASGSSELDSEKRKVYDVIAARDLFRPYQRREVARKPAPKKSEDVPKYSSPEPPENSQSRVVSLANWAGEQEIHIRDTRKNEVRAYKPGESLLGGKIVMIDYRMLPLPNKPHINSSSRVILKIGSDYWIVELGQNLSDKRRLSTSDLPAELKGGLQ